MSWFEGKKKWIAGVLAGIGGIIAVDQGLQSPPKESKPRDMGTEVVRGEPDAADARAESLRKIAEDRAEEKRQEDIANVKVAIDALLQQGGGLEAETDKQLIGLQEMFKNKFSEFPEAKVEQSSDAIGYIITLKDAPGYTLFVGREEEDFAISVPVGFSDKGPNFVEYQKTVVDLNSLPSIISKRIQINVEINKFYKKEISSDQLRQFFRGLGLEERHHI
ncbi:MAG: hypothetical protein EXS55_04125 [Candidatus Magasanikbacteria bacterium]|nr:hypothetical protein [Candidatus Magasanikbacteria bacterium]